MNHKEGFFPFCIGIMLSRGFKDAGRRTRDEDEDEGLKDAGRRTRDEDEDEGLKDAGLKDAGPASPSVLYRIALRNFIFALNFCGLADQSRNTPYQDLHNYPQ